MGQFLMHSSVIWLNPFPSLGRMKKDPELTVFGKARIFSHETITLFVMFSFAKINVLYSNMFVIFTFIFKQMPESTPFPYIASHKHKILVLLSCGTNLELCTELFIAL